MEKIRRIKFAGLILAGGFAKRLGGPAVVDKPLLHPFGADKPNLLEHSYNILAPLVEQIWLACRADHLYTGYNCLIDLESGIGPISGIYTGLLKARQCGYTHLLVLACDLPYMQTNFLRILYRASLTPLNAKRPYLLACEASKNYAPARNLSKKNFLSRQKFNNFKKVGQLKFNSLLAKLPLMTAFSLKDSGIFQSLVAIYSTASLAYFEMALRQKHFGIYGVIPSTKRKIVEYLPESSHIFFNINRPEDLALIAQTAGQVVGQLANQLDLNFLVAQNCPKKLK